MFLNHRHPYYEPLTPRDEERHLFHESIIATDLMGQRDFPWGHVFCRLEPRSNLDWLSPIYVPFSGVPLQKREAYRVLMEHEAIPGNRTMRSWRKDARKAVTVAPVAYSIL